MSVVVFSLISPVTLDQVPDPCLWQPSHHVSQHAANAADGGSFVERIMKALQANSIIVENQDLIAKLVNCVIAFVDGNSQYLAVFVQLNFRGLLLAYLNQPQAPFTVDLLRSLTEALTVFCGHCTLCVDDGDGIDEIDRADSMVSMSEAEMSLTLSATHRLLAVVLAGGSLVPVPAGSASVVDEPTLIHLVTVYGLLLPLVPMAQLSVNCRPLMDQSTSPS